MINIIIVQTSFWIRGNTQKYKSLQNIFKKSTSEDVNSDNKILASKYKSEQKIKKKKSKIMFVTTTHWNKKNKENKTLKTRKKEKTSKNEEAKSDI